MRISMAQGLPRVSVLTICRNSERTIRRCLESVLTQDYPHLEYVIQDGASTDGTLAIIEEYRGPYGDRMRVVSERDDGPDDAHYRGLCRCSGEIIGLCWADEELLPGAIAWGVRNLERHAGTAAVYGDVYPTDLDGKIFGPDVWGKTPAWDLEKYLCWEIVPSYVGSFFRASALQASRFFEFKRDTDSCMYDYYAKVGMRYSILYVPGCVAKYAVHPGQLSSTPAVLWRMVRTLDSSIAHLMDDPQTPAHVRALRARARAGVRLSLLDSLVNNAGAVDEAKQMLREAFQYQANPSFLEAVLWGIFSSLLSQGQYADVLDFLDIVLEHGVATSHYMLWRASVLWHLGRFDEAKQRLREALQHLPQSVQLENELVGAYNSLLSQGQYAAALDFLDTVVEYGLVTSASQLLRASVLCRLGRFRECVAALELQLTTPSQYTPQVQTMLVRMQTVLGAVQ